MCRTSLSLRLIGSGFHGVLSESGDQEPELLDSTVDSNRA